jgi:hypothetical protein
MHSTPKTTVETTPAIAIQAGLFIDTVRKAAKEQAIGVTGRSYVSNDILNTIPSILLKSARITAFSTDVKGDSAFKKEYNTICARFEELCRRLEINIPASLRPEIYKLLSAELFSNAALFHSPPGKILSTTVYNGPLNQLFTNEEFACFADAPGIFKRAATSSPSNPEAFLRGVIQSIERLSTNEEFACFADTPGIFKHAAAGSPSNPEAFLRQQMRCPNNEVTAGMANPYNTIPDGIFR